MRQGRYRVAFFRLLLCLAGGWLPLSRSDGLYKESAEFKPAGWTPHPFNSIPAETENIHMAPICGTWQNRYARIHRAALSPDATKEQKKFLVYSCNYKRQSACGGLGDRLLGMLTTFMIATLSDRAFVSDQPPDLEMVYEPVVIDWRRPPGLQIEPPSVKNPKGACAFDHAGKENYVFSEKDTIVELMLHDKNLIIENFLACFQLLTNVTTVVIRFNRGLTVGGVRSPGVWGKKLRAWGLREPYITGCMLRYLLRPKKEIEEAIKPVVDQLRGPDTFSICIHSRPGMLATTDDSLGTSSMIGGRTFTQTENLIACAKKLTEYWTNADYKVKWFLMASSYAAKQIIKRREPEKVVITEWVPLHTERSRNKNHTSNEKEALLLAGKEWTIFSKCNLFVLHDSGLSKTAALYALKPMSMHIFPRQFELTTENWHQYCQPGLPTAMSQVAGRNWSGA